MLFEALKCFFLTTLDEDQLCVVDHGDKSASGGFAGLNRSRRTVMLGEEQWIRTERRVIRLKSSSPPVRSKGTKPNSSTIFGISRSRPEANSDAASCARDDGLAGRSTSAI